MFIIFYKKKKKTKNISIRDEGQVPSTLIPSPSDWVKGDGQILMSLIQLEVKVKFLNESNLVGGWGQVPSNPIPTQVPNDRVIVGGNSKFSVILS